MSNSINERSIFTVNSLMTDFEPIPYTLYHPSETARQIADVLEIMIARAQKAKSEYHFRTSDLKVNIVGFWLCDSFNKAADEYNLHPNTIRDKFTRRLDMNANEAAFILQDFLIETVFRGDMAINTDLWKVLEESLTAEDMIFIEDMIEMQLCAEDAKEESEEEVMMLRSMTSVKASDATIVISEIMIKMADYICKFRVKKEEVNDAVIRYWASSVIKDIAKKRGVNESTVYSNIDRRMGISFEELVAKITSAMKELYFEGRRIFETTLWKEYLCTELSTDDLQTAGVILGTIALDTKIDVGLCRDYL